MTFGAVVKTNESLQKTILQQVWADPIFGFRTILPEWFPKKMPWFHRGIVALVLQRTDFLLNFGREEWASEVAEWTVEDLELICEHFLYRVDPDDPESPTIPLFVWDREANVVHLRTSRFLQVMIPRGFSKTTLFNALILYMIGFKMDPFIVYLSETASHAEQQMQNVKREIEQNEMFIELFGQLNPERNDPGKWTGNFIECLNGVTVLATGRGGQVRGKNIGGKRPGKILLDDVEDDESVATDEQRKKTLRWLMRVVKPALPKRSGNIYILGTLLHRESMMMQVMRDKGWVNVRFGAMLPNGTALDRKFMTEEEWLRERENYKAHGMLADFYMEYQSQIHVDADNRVFKTDEWKVIEYDRSDFEMVALAMDPSISEDEKSDRVAFAVVGMLKTGRLHVLDMHSEVFMHPRAQIDKFFELKFKWDCDVMGIEAVAFQKALIHLVYEEMARKSQTYGNKAYFAVQPILHGKTGKTARIKGILAPRYAAGYITHQRRFRDLESEAIDWPNGKVDNLDVEAMAIGLLDPVATIPGEQPDEDGNTIDLSRADWHEIQESWQEQCP